MSVIWGLTEMVDYCTGPALVIDSRRLACILPGLESQQPILEESRGSLQTVWDH